LVTSETNQKYNLSQLKLFKSKLSNNLLKYWNQGNNQQFKRSQSKLQCGRGRSELKSL